MTIIESEQSKETRLTQISRGPFIFRFASYRKSEDAQQGLRSEDYFVGDLSPTQASFALCDGVGSSFYGNIGSQFLGETLLHWLQNVSKPEDFSESTKRKWFDNLISNLKNELNNNVKLATSIVQEKEITASDQLIKIAETNQRDDFGTQSNLVCGLIWPTSPQLPDGLVMLFWLGNARVRIFNNNEDLTGLLNWGVNPDQLKEVWSSKDGVVGTLYSYRTDLSKITTVIAYSDGLENLDNYITPDLDGTQIESLVKRAQSAKDDDVSFLELTVGQSSSTIYSDDIVGKIRNHYRVPAIPNSNYFQKKYESLQRKYNDLEVSFSKAKKGWLVLIISLPVLTCSFGMLLGSFLARPEPSIETVTPTATRILVPSRTITPIMPTATLTLFPTSDVTSTTDTQIVILSETPPPTSTETATATPTETSTPTETLTVMPITQIP